MAELARLFIATLLVICSAGIYYFVTTGLCPEAWKGIVEMIVGSLITNITLVVSYYFGSSDGSRVQRETISKALEKETNGPNPPPRQG